MRKCVATLVLFVATGGIAAAAEPTGEWLVKNQEARVRIEECANGLWGFLSWTREPNVDSNNPDPAKRSRPIVGVPIVRNLKPAGPNKWQGEAYNVANGKTYSVSISLLSDNELSIQGCVLGGLLCGGENWTRVSKPATTGSRAKGGAPRACYD
jgi:uncharacterized protein (DUF2147 family)